MNNAGFGTWGTFEKIPTEQHLAMIQDHILATVRLSRAALPGMMSRRHGAIINVSSIAAFLPNPGNVTYCASKAYLNSFSLALQSELSHTGVRVQALCPGFTVTEFHDNPEYAARNIRAKIPAALWMSADDVVAASLKELRRGRVICIPGLKNRVLVALGRSGLARLFMERFARRLRRELDTPRPEPERRDP